MIHTRDQLLDWVQENTPRPCVKRAADSGGMVNLGVFKKLTEKWDQGWIVVICSPTKRFYNIAIVADRYGNPNGCCELETIPWQDWIGDHFKDELYSGDGSKILKQFKKRSEQWQKTS